MAGFAFNSLAPEIRDVVLGSASEHLREEARLPMFERGVQQGFLQLAHLLREAQSNRAPLMVGVEKKPRAKKVAAERTKKGAA